MTLKIELYIRYSKFKKIQKLLRTTIGQYMAIYYTLKEMQQITINNEKLSIFWIKTKIKKLIYNRY